MPWSTSTARSRATRPRELPVSLGSDDTLTVWLNGEKILSENVQRACAPTRPRPMLKLKQGKNQLLLKVCQGDGDWAFYFKAPTAMPPAITWAFEDVSDAVGLGANGIGSTVKGDTLTVCDVNGDGRPDFLYGAGTGMLVLNTPQGLRRGQGLAASSYKAGKVGPVFGDFDNDGLPDLFVPQKDGCKLFHNDGKGKFTDVTAKAGLDKFTGWATLRRLGRRGQRRPPRPGDRLSARPEPLFPQQGRRHVRGRDRGDRPGPAHLQHAGGVPGGPQQRRRARHGLQQRGPGIVRAAGQPGVGGEADAGDAAAWRARRASSAAR